MIIADFEELPEENFFLSRRYIQCNNN